MENTNKESPDDWAISFKQLGLLVLFFVLGVITALMLGNVHADTPTTFSTTELIGFTLSVILSGASIILAVAAIALGKSSEQAVINRSDESIRLQNEVFVRTTEALQRIEASTGVTEKRIEDIISGRVGDLSHRIAELATQGVGGIGKSFKELEEEIRESILQSVKEDDKRTSVERRREERAKRMEIDKKRLEEYQLNHQSVLNAFANRGDLKVIKSAHGSVTKAGDELLDGIFAKEGIRVGVSTFASDAPPEYLKIFAANISSEIASGNVTTVYVVFFEGVNHQSQIDAISSTINQFKQEIEKNIHVLNINPEKAEEEIGKLVI